jgi:hypothetical protein
MRTVKGFEAGSTLGALALALHILGLGISSTGCCPINDLHESKRFICHSALWQALSSNKRGYIYFASFFAYQNGGPDIPENASSLSDWKEHARKVMEWLRKQDLGKLVDLVQRYPRWEVQQAPFYPD